MKKALIYIVISMFSLGTFATDFLTQKERDKILVAFRELKLYQDVPNYIKCTNHQTDLEKFVCENKDYLKMFNLLSMANVYAWENATKREVNHVTFNERNMKHWTVKYDANALNKISLCYDLKIATTNLLGGMSPYKIINVEGDFEEDFVVQENKHGMILSSRSGYKIYVGISYDVFDSNKKKGSWCKKNNTFFISINGSKIIFYYDENE